MRPRRRPALLAALLLAALAARAGAAPAGAPSPRSELWRRNLAEAAGLPSRVEALSAALAAGDARAIIAQCGPGRLRLQLRTLDLPPTLCGHSQARALLRAYFASGGGGELRIGPALLETGGRRARVAFELQSVAPAASLPAQRRIVAVFRGGEGDVWHLEALRCP